MTLAEQVDALQRDLEEATEELTALKAAIDKLPNAPAGFGNSHEDRVAWTARFVKDNWAVRQEAAEWKQRALRAERAVNACVSASEEQPK